MKKNLYNSKDENYKHVVNLLKELPKVKAEDNFEYNLRVKIQNKNFGLKTEENVRFSLWKILVPTTSLVAASLLGFLFLLNNSNDNTENPFQLVPKLRTEAMGNLLISSDNAEISDSDVIIKKENENISELNSLKGSENKIDYVSNDQAIKKVDFPFKDYKSTNLDEAIGQNRNLPQSDIRATLVGRKNSNLYFDGFYIREEVDKKNVEAMKARLDSLKNVLKNEDKR